MKLGVLGAGAWGTALAIQAAKKINVCLWGRDSGHVSGMQKARSNPMYLGDFTFPENLTLNHSLDSVVSQSDIILTAVPTSAFADIIQNIQTVNPSKPIIWSNKGLDQKTNLFPHEIIKKNLKTDSATYGVLSGPSFAAELVRDLPTAVTFASNCESLSKKTAEIFHHNSMRVYLSNDITGVSIGGSLKNIVAIAAGISDGMGFGNNARAALITRGMAEITRLGVSLGAKEETFTGLAGIGDLLLTCTGQYSRNREVGLRLAEGKKIDQILKSLGHVAEGVSACNAINNRIKSNEVEMPITREVYKVLNNKVSAEEAVQNLLSRGLKSEI